MSAPAAGVAFVAGGLSLQAGRAKRESTVAMMSLSFMEDPRGSFSSVPRPAPNVPGPAGSLRARIDLVSHAPLWRLLAPARAGGDGLVSRRAALRRLAAAAGWALGCGRGAQAIEPAPVVAIVGGGL